eukprot:Lankesteria_metandrocarpae@DN1508_c0_g1_i1.p1
MAMKYVAAYMMAVLAGKDQPSKKDVEGIISAVGGEVDATVLTAFMTKVAGKETHELVASGMSKLQSVAVASGGGAPAAGGATAEIAKEEAPEEEEEEEEEDMGFSLFD